MPDPTLSGFGPTLAVNENDTPQLLDADVTFTDPDNDFNGGSLTVSGLRAEDRVAIRNQGTNPGEISVSGSAISYGGVLIGSFAGGVGGTLTVTFNAAANSAAIEALIENLTYANVSDAPNAERTLVLNVTDANGGDLGPSSVVGSFSELAGALNPFNGIDLSPPIFVNWTTPSFVDLDNDGDMDLVTGERGSGTLITLENVGDDADADSFGDFVRRPGSQNPFNGFNHSAESAPTFVDLDRDGDMDLVVGTGAGLIVSYENVGDDADADVLADFVQIAAGSPLGGVDVGFGAIPAFADFDGDGDMDAVVGVPDGILRAFENVGDGADAGAFDDFVELAGTNNPFNGINIGFKSAPAFVDLDGDGDLDLMVGEQFGTFRAYENVGDGGDPNAFDDFIELTGAANPLNGVDVGNLSRPSFADLDGDGAMEAVTGDASGALRTFDDVARRGAAIHVEVAAVNDAPTLSGLASSLTMPGDGTPLVMDGDVAFLDPDFLSNGGTLTVSGLLAEDRVAIRNQGTGPGQIGVSGGDISYGGVLIGTFTGGVGITLAVTFNDAATSPALDALIQNLTYANASATPTASRTLSLNVADGDGGALAGGPQSITVELPSGAAPVAQDDALATDEATPITGSVFADNGSGIDDDADGPAPGVAAVNGSAANVGTQIVLPSGALLTVDVDGTFSYDPNGAFDEFPAAGSGASNTPATDSFTYTLAGGGTATVTLTIDGIDSDDLLIGTAGDDVLTGGVGNDAYVIDGAGDTVIENADEGRDEIRTALAVFSMAALANVEDLVGTSAAGQALTGNAGDNRIVGNAGADTLAGEDGADRLEGGAGVDRLSGGTGADTILGGIDDDVLFGEDGVDTMLGEDGNDRLEGAAGVDGLLGGIGADYLDGGADGDWLFGEDGDDTILGGGGDDYVEAGAGADGVLGGVGADRIFGGSLGDWLFGEDGDDILFGDEGNDHIEGGAGLDTIRGGAGADFIQGGADGDSLFGDADNDTLVGGGGGDWLEGGAGEDGISGGAGNDYLNLGTTTPGSLADAGGWLFGEDGDDTLVASDTIGGQSVYLDGGAGNDGITGGQSGDLIDGGAGNDFLFGGSGINTIRGGEGDDFIDGGSGDDGIIDRSGNNHIVGGSGRDWIIAEGNNIISGGSDSDTIFTDEGVDLIDGDQGNDVIDAGPGNDKLYGGEGLDTLIGGEGDDELYGESGIDHLTGGAGLDNFVFSSGGIDQADIITDYSAADDSIHLQIITFNALPLGALDPAAFRFGTVAGDADDRVIYDSATGRVWYDRDGAGGASQVLVVTIQGDLAGVTASEFTVI